MRTVDLREYEKSAPVSLTVSERDALSNAIPSLGISPVAGQRDSYSLTPQSTVGAVEIGNLSIRIQPKLSIRRVLFLASQAMGIVDFRPEPFSFARTSTPQDIIAPLFIVAAQRAFARGLLHGYRTEEEALMTVRGRIDFSKQLRRRFDLPLPVEVRYDDFTEDILANRLVKAAANRLAALRIDNRRWHEGLGRVDANLVNVTLTHFGGRDVPTVVYDRLNRHYREVVELSRLVLRHTGIDAGRGETRASGFLMDMNTVFQEFVTNALRQELGLSTSSFRSDDGPAAAHLDVAERVRLRPDFSWWEGGECVFAGDAKYKVTEDGQGTHADLYQALAYSTALDLTGALLVYAEGSESEHRVRHAGKLIGISTVKLEGTVAEIQESIEAIAGRIRRLRTETLGQRVPRLSQ